MNKQIIIFTGLIAIVGLIFYQRNNVGAPLDSRGDEEVLEIANEIAIEVNEKIDDTAIEKKETIDLPTDGEGDKSTESTKKEKITESEAFSEPTVKNIEGQTFTPYTNKAVNYIINRPDNWYWQHLFITELTVHKNSEDILAISRKPLPEINNIFDSAILIEVSNINNDRANEFVSLFTKTATTVAGKNAIRYDGTRDGKKMTEYHLRLDSEKLIRFIYSNDEVNEIEKAIFETIIESFSLN